MKKPTERRKIQGYSVQRSSKRYNANFKNLNFKNTSSWFKPSDDLLPPLLSSPASPPLWSDEAEEENSRRLRQQMVQSIRNNDHRGSICQRVYQALETVPRHYFMSETRLKINFSADRELLPIHTNHTNNTNHTNPYQQYQSIPIIPIHSSHKSIPAIPITSNNKQKQAITSKNKLQTNLTDPDQLDGSRPILTDPDQS